MQQQSHNCVACNASLENELKVHVIKSDEQDFGMTKTGVARSYSG